MKTKTKESEIRQLAVEADTAWEKGDLRRAFELLLRGAKCGDLNAQVNLGYFFDTGLHVKPDKKKALLWYYRAYRQGVAEAASNIATVHRDLGDIKRMFWWSRRAAAMGDGDAHVGVGYCYQYGIGVKADPAVARKRYRQAIRSRRIIPWIREEGMYHLAVLLLETGVPRSRQHAIQWLRTASRDGDYPQAGSLLRQLQRGKPGRICRCRRGFARSIKGQAACPWHPRVSKSS